LTRKRWGASGSLLWAAAFLASTQVGKILVYETHPEAAYPFFVLLWLWSLGLDGSGKIRTTSLILATVLCMGVKEDSFLVLGPWLLWGVVVLKGRQRLAVGGASILAGCVFFLQTWAVRNWSSGVWGPSQWMGETVRFQVSLGFFKGMHWSGIQDIFTIIHNLLDDRGGIWGCLKSVGKFLVSRPWLSLVILTPWVLVQKRFWATMGPMAFAYSLLEGPKLLWTYYSAPLLGSFWFCASAPDGRSLNDSPVHGRWKLKREYYPVWAFGAALLLGSGSVDFFFPAPEVKQIKEEVQALAPCLRGKGLVSSHLIGLVPLEKVWTERIPKTLDQWQKLDHLLFSPDWPGYEISQPAAQALEQELKKNPEWTQVGSDCRPRVNEVRNEKVVLFLRRR
jgi:hypothetical protein